MVMALEAVCSLQEVTGGQVTLAVDNEKAKELVELGDSLSKRELEVLQCIANGLTNAGIAERLSISPKTVDNHRTSLMRKLDVRSSTALVVRAVRDGLVQI